MHIIGKGTLKKIHSPGNFLLIRISVKDIYSSLAFKKPLSWIYSIVLSIVFSEVECLSCFLKYMVRFLLNY